ncbi:rhodanese-like domain-containing protein [Chloroflexota bacterium]
MKAGIRRLAILALLAILIGLSAVIGGCVGNDSTTGTQVIENISTQEASVFIRENKDNQHFIILDVRTPDEYASGHLENAINLDYYSATFRDEVNELDKQEKYLVYCRSGKRSEGALNIMKELGFREVYNMLGGIVHWEAEGLPIVK